MRPGFDELVGFLACEHPPGTVEPEPHQEPGDEVLGHEHLDEEEADPTDSHPGHELLSGDGANAGPRPQQLINANGISIDIKAHKQC